MEDRLTSPAGGRPGWLPLAALAAIIVITVAWWALAFWPAAGSPSWLARTREVCFGSGPDGLPSAGGWVLLIGEPLGMLGALVAVWGRELRRALARLARGWPGRLALGSVSLGLAIGVVAVGARVRTARAEPVAAFIADSLPGVAPVDRPAPPLSLVNQHGDTVRLAELAGRPVLVTFAFAHCTAICPAQVQGVLTARRRAAETDTGSRPAAVIVTVDPWRDTPSRLPAIAQGWRLEADEHVLSGSVEAVEAVLADWRIRTERDPVTGDVGHPATVYLIARSGRIAALGLGTGRGLAAALRRM